MLEYNPVRCGTVPVRVSPCQFFETNSRAVAPENRLAFEHPALVEGASCHFYFWHSSQPLLSTHPSVEDIVVALLVICMRLL